MNKTFAAAGALALIWSMPTPADAARCPSGSIYRPSKGVCVSKAAAQRAGIYKPRKARYTKASINNRVTRPPKRRIADPTPVPPPTPPWAQTSPMIEGQIDAALNAPAPAVFVHPRFGSLAPMPDSPAAWAARNAATFGEN